MTLWWVSLLLMSDWNRNGAHEMIGSFSTCVDELTRRCVCLFVCAVFVYSFGVLRVWGGGGVLLAHHEGIQSAGHMAVPLPESPGPGWFRDLLPVRCVLDQICLW